MQIYSWQPKDSPSTVGRTPSRRASLYVQQESKIYISDSNTNPVYIHNEAGMNSGPRMLLGWYLYSRVWCWLTGGRVYAVHGRFSPGRVCADQVSRWLAAVCVDRGRLLGNARNCIS